MVSIDLSDREADRPAGQTDSEFDRDDLDPPGGPTGSLAYVSWRTNNPIFGDPRILAIRSVDTGETRELDRPGALRSNQLGAGRTRLVTAGTDLKGRNWIFRIDAQTGEADDPWRCLQASRGRVRNGRRMARASTIVSHSTQMEQAGTSPSLNESSASRRRARNRRGDLGSINLSPDGRWIAAQKVESSTQSHSVVIMLVDGGQTRDLLRTTENQRIVRFSGMPWTPDGRNVIVRKILGGDMRQSTSELWLVPITGAPPRKLDVDVSQWAAGNRGIISLSPDGRQIAFLSGQGNSEVWALENFLPAQKTNR